MKLLVLILRAFSPSGGGKASKTISGWEEHVAVKHPDLPHSILYSSRMTPQVLLDPVLPSDPPQTVCTKRSTRACCGHVWAVSRHGHRPAGWADEGKDRSDAYEGAGKTGPESGAKSWEYFIVLFCRFFFILTRVQPHIVVTSQHQLRCDQCVFTPLERLKEGAFSRCKYLL